MSVFVTLSCLFGLHEMSIWRLYFDGAAGPRLKRDRVATYGWVLEHDGHVVDHGHGVIGRGSGVTCNVAEWAALERALGVITSYEFDDLIIHGDSRLVINQLTGRWQTHADHLRPYQERCLELLAGHEWAARWISRERNAKAHELAGIAYVALGKGGQACKKAEIFGHHCSDSREKEGDHDR